jgi:predicted kinase
MRVLLLFRGAPGSGKSTFIDNHGLRPYALSADEIRLQCQSAQQDVYGEDIVSMDNEKEVWNNLFRLLDCRMSKGEFTVIDATNSKTSEMNKYKEMCESYRYRMFIVDFTKLPIDECKRRNIGRPHIKRVPEAVIDKMYSRFQNQKIPSGIKVIDPEHLEDIFIKKFDMSKYEKVIHIGDIHGCYTVLNEYFKDGLNDNYMYIFLGDFIDRGIENAEVLKFLLNIYNKPNVLMLEGNHERWLWIYANGGVGRSKEFEYFTRPQLDDANIDPKDIRQLYRRLGQCAWYTYGNKEIFVSHGGIAKIPNNLGFLSTEQMIKGVGGYDDYMQVVSTWDNTMPSNCYQIFGHRNPGKQPTKIGERVFDLEGNVEFGGDLRIVELSADGFTPIEIHNTVFKTQEERKKSREIKHSSIADVVMQLRGNKFINEKKYGNISAFNFSKNAFYDGVWNDQTILARGLYINTDLMKITARGFEKFFKINERPETKLGMLKHKLQFPVTCYVKENGFLGLVSYDHEEDDLFITTKSNPEGDFAAWFRCMIYDKLSTEAIETMKTISKEEEVTFVFECVDMHNDPHIIEYPESNVYLLAVIKNQIDFEQWSYEKLSQVASDLGVNCKIKGYVLNDWTEFYDWYNEVTAEDYEYNGHKIEGFVIEDANGFMVKVKSWYYNFWKFMRGVAHATLRNGRYPRTGSLDSALANDFYAFCQELYNNTAPENRDLIPRDIVWLRSKFDYWREKNGKR